MKYDRAHTYPSQRIHQSWIVALDFKSAATENFHRDRIHLFFVNNKILVAFKE